MNLGILFQVNNSVRCYPADVKLQPITPVLRTPGWVPVKPVDPQPVRPRLHPERPEAGSRGWSMVARVLAWLSLITLMLCGLGWQRAEHARKEYRLARDLAKAESREAVLYRNHNVITSGLVADLAALKQQQVEMEYLYASTAASQRRSPVAQVHQTQPATSAAGLVRQAMHRRGPATSEKPVPAISASAASGARARTATGSVPAQTLGPRSARPLTTL